LKDEKHYGKRVKQRVKLLKGKRLRSDLAVVARRGLAPRLFFGGWASIGSGGWIKAAGMWLSSGSVIARGGMQPAWVEVCASARMLA